MKGKVSDMSMDNLDAFILNLQSYYPELHNYIFVEFKMKSVLRKHWALVKFIEDRNIPKESSYNKIWHYIIKNEDKHDWWML